VSEEAKIEVPVSRLNALAAEFDEQRDLGARRANSRWIARLAKVAIAVAVPCAGFVYQAVSKASAQIAELRTEQALLKQRLDFLERLTMQPHGVLP
jgi:hypothetical protein